MSKSPSLRRIQADIRELALDPSDQYYAAPLENDMFEWHFTIRGAEGTDFEGGVYHGRILLPAEYPFKPPNIVFLTPTGRFETGVKVCLSFSAYHPELWQPAWGIRLILEALISFLPTPADGAIGAIDWTPQERKRLAKKSVEYCCPICGPPIKLLPRLDQARKEKSDASRTRFQKEIEQLHQLQKDSEAENRRMADMVSSTPEQDDKDKKPSPGAKDPPKASPAPQEVATTPAKLASKVEDQAAQAATVAEHVEEKPPSQQSSINDSLSPARTTQSTNSTPAPLPQDAPSHEESADTTTTTTPVASSEATKDSISWFSDPVVHGIFITFSAVVFLLVRKINALLVELQELEHM